MGSRWYGPRDTDRLFPWSQVNCPGCGSWMLRISYGGTVKVRAKVRAQARIGRHPDPDDGWTPGHVLTLHGRQPPDPDASDIDLYDVKCRCGRRWVIEAGSYAIHPCA